MFDVKTMNSQAKLAPIHIRARASQRSLIDKAAAMVRKNRSDFMLEASCQYAEDVILNARLIQLDPLSYNQFVAALDAPVAQNETLRQLLHKKSPWE